jgi:hypothetical protein
MRPAKPPAAALQSSRAPLPRFDADHALAKLVDVGQPRDRFHRPSVPFRRQALSSVESCGDPLFVTPHLPGASHIGTARAHLLLF